MQLTTVEGMLRPDPPPSIIISILPCNWSSTSLAVSGFCIPERLADVTAIGPAALSNLSATGCSGIRTPMVVDLDTASGMPGSLGTTIVNGPGQKCNASIRADRGTFELT